LLIAGYFPDIFRPDLIGHPQAVLYDIMQRSFQLIY